MTRTHRAHPTPGSPAPWHLATVLVLAACRPSPPSGLGHVDAAAEVVPSPPAAAAVPESGPIATAGAPAGLRCLAEHLGGEVEGEALVLDGVRFAWSDGRTKTTAERIESPDLEDLFALGYPSGPIAPVTDEEQDPGRIRHEPLFRAVYGADAGAVSRALVKVRFAGHTVMFHRRAAEALARVDTKLAPLVAREPRFFAKLGGTFATRAIAGTDRTSAHAWGIAIDLDPAASDYWRNAPKAGWKNRVPREIVDAFEAEGFVWGGRWFHYDTMHFEYRPELLDPRCRTAPQDR